MGSLSFKDAAERVLREEAGPLTAREIADLALSKGYIETSGATPDATIAAQIYVDIKKNTNTRFEKVSPGVFSLRKAVSGPSTEHLTFKTAALKILKEAGVALSATEIIEIALSRGYVKSVGKTPAATLASRLYTDIRDNEKSPFVKTKPGVFAVKRTADNPQSPALPKSSTKVKTSFPKTAVAKGPIPVEAKAPVAPKVPIKVERPIQRIISDYNRQFRHALLERIRKMDPFEFEHVVAHLLTKMGYENVKTTPSRGDKGIDIFADIVVGLSKVRTAIQVKRYAEGNNIQPASIRELRGSAEVDQRGLFITTSKFTKKAIEEASANNKVRIELVNGDELIALFSKHGVGVKVERVNVYNLDDSYFKSFEKGK